MARNRMCSSFKILASLCCKSTLWKLIEIRNFVFKRDSITCLLNTRQHKNHAMVCFRAHCHVYKKDYYCTKYTCIHHITNVSTQYLIHTLVPTIIDLYFSSSLLAFSPDSLTSCATTDGPKIVKHPNMT